MQTQEIEKVEVLPAEVLQLTSAVPENKKNEILLTLNQIFAGTDQWEKQIDAIVIKDVDDKYSIGMAEVARKNAKDAKVNARKIIEAKRKEIKSEISEYTLVDSVWLKTGQIAELFLSTLEKKAEAKADFVKIYNAQQKEIETQKRINIIAEYGVFNRIEFENLSATAFEAFVNGLQAKKEAELAKEKQEKELELAKQEAQKLHNQRKEQLIPYWIMLTEVQRNADLSKVPEARFQEVLADVKNRRKAQEDEAERLRLENEILAAQLKASEESVVKQRVDVEEIKRNLTEQQNKALAKFPGNLPPLNVVGEMVGEAGRSLKIESEPVVSNKDSLDENFEFAMYADSDDKSVTLFEQSRKNEIDALGESNITDREVAEKWIDSFKIPGTLLDLPEITTIKEKFDLFKLWCHQQIENLV